MQKPLVLLMLFLSACAGYDKEPLQSTTMPEVQNAAGMKIYQKDCAACHGGDGTGAFAGVPDLTQVAGFRKDADSDAALFQHIKHVKEGLKTPGSPMAMPAKGGDLNLTEQDIKEVLKYMREKFTHE